MPSQRKHRSLIGEPEPGRVLSENRKTNHQQPTLPRTAILTRLPINESLSPELRNLAKTFATVIIEVISGARAINQLEDRISETALLTIRWLRRAHIAKGLQLSSVRIQSPSPEVLEIAAQLKQGTHYRAAAIRLMKTKNRWMCTRFEIALTPNMITKAG